jgi:alginate O-acetyltransferase complex protein AlgI
MLFNSLTYLVFLIVVVPFCWILSGIYRRWLILIASLAFYGFWRIEFVFLITLSAFVDYYFSLKIYNEKREVRRKYWLLSSLTTNISLLAYFKYTYFIVDNISILGNTLGQDWMLSPGNIILPLGISFYTFLSISYTLDIYRRIFDPIRNFGIYLTYVMFWPHMIAGPILRANELITQIVRMPHIKLVNVTDGIKMILTGFFLKVMLADQLAPWVDEAFAASPNSLGGLDVWTMAFGFGLQIYFDFAGYSMIAIGSALMIGVRFPENFNWPYLSTSPRDFWKRWHITLSSWIRDYLYLPLCGARFRNYSEGGIDVQANETKSGFIRLTLALFVAWFIMGLWHGAGWKFALWGIWHATFIFIYRQCGKWLPKISKQFKMLIGWSFTLPVIMLGWIPFRADSMSTTLALLGRIVDFSSYRALGFRENFYLLVFVITIAMLGAYFVTHSKNPFLNNMLLRKISEFISLSVMIFLLFIFFRPVSQFIYFQF